MSKSLAILGAIFPILALIFAQTAMADDAGYTAGSNAAKNDWENKNGFHGTCEEHNIDPVNNEGFCGSFKDGYTHEWNALVSVS